ncbi:MAG: hypothetical protein U9Q30_07370 [Campylobacterota bacterium]|nr:hypothetical protein [Campylobacterota bacterium]
MEEKRIYTIHKANSLIKAKLNNFNLQQLKFLNSIYYLAQKNKNKIQNNSNIISVKYSKLIDLMGYHNRKTHPLSKIIKDSQSVLIEPIILNNYITKKGNLKEWKKIQLIKSITINKGYRNTLDIKITKQFFNLINQKKNWTKIDTTFINENLSSLFAQRLYEYLKSYNNLESRKLLLYLDKFIEIFEAKKVYFSTAKLKINRSMEIINSVSDLDIKVSYHKNNLIVFNFKNVTDIDIKANLKNQKKIEKDKIMIANILKKISI